MLGIFFTEIIRKIKCIFGRLSNKRCKCHILKRIEGLLLDYFLKLLEQFDLRNWLKLYNHLKFLTVGWLIWLISILEWNQKSSLHSILSAIQPDHLSIIQPLNQNNHIIQNKTIGNLFMKRNNFNSICSSPFAHETPLLTSIVIF